MERTTQEKCARSFSVTVPPIACSFPWKNHPDALKLKELSDAWVLERCEKLPAACQGQIVAFFFSPAVLIGSVTHLLATLFFPNALSAHLLLPIAKLMGWYFMLDNFVDDPSEMGANCAHTERLIGSLVAVFQSRAGGQAAVCNAYITSTSIFIKNPTNNLCIDEPITSTATSTGTPISIQSQQATNSMSVDEQLAHHLILVDSAREWWEEMQLNMSTSHQARFSALFTAYLNANHSQVPFRKSLNMPDLETYFRIRTETVGWYPLLVLIEHCLDIELDEEALMHPLLIKLHLNVCECILLVNDITSFSKEYTQGDFFNIIFLVCFHELGLCKLPTRNWQALLSQEVLQEGVRKVSEMIKKRDEECVRIMEEIRGLPVLMSKVGMDAYLEEVGHNLSGNLYWHYKSKRYGLCVPTSLTDGNPDLHAHFQVHLSCPSNASSTLG